MAMTDRTRAEIEQEITGKRRERELYVSAQGVGKIHGEIDRLLEEWEDADGRRHEDAPTVPPILADG